MRFESLLFDMSKGLQNKSQVSIYIIHIYLYKYRTHEIYKNPKVRKTELKTKKMINEFFNESFIFM